ncbi:MAG TPA: ATP-binding cassette domain-containing protein [Bacteroidales bacterium]|nr:ATP-binding cassette domain-containing protein [Bacteroidales bacterium]
MSDLLEVDSIRKSFGDKQVLTDVFLTCRIGDIIGLLGRNGTGKSTLLKIIFGSLYTDYKFIRINNEVLDNPFKSKTISYLPQDDFLPKNITVRKAAEIYLNYFALTGFLEDELLSRLAATRIGNLSGGESRYLEVKLLLNLESTFVLLDEPFNGISPLQVEMIKTLIREKSSKKGIILTDHDYRNVLEVTNRQYLLFDGGIKSVKSKTDLINWGYIPER